MAPDIVFESKIDLVYPALLRKLVKTFDLDSRWLQKFIRTEYMSGPTTAMSVKVMSGTLRASVLPIKAEIKGDSVQAGVSIGGDIARRGGTPAGRYARVHVGPRGQVTTIRPIRGKYLTIPFPQEYVTKTGKIMKPPAVLSRRTSRKFVTFRKVKEVRIPARIHPEEIFAAFSLKLVGDLKGIGINIMEE